MATAEMIAIADGLWEKALRDGKVEVEMPDAAGAKRLRMHLYNAAKRPRASATVKMAKDCCIVQLDKGTLFITKIDRAAEVQAALMALGGKTSEEEQRIEEQALESQRRMLERMGAGEGSGSVVGVASKFGIGKR